MYEAVSSSVPSDNIPGTIFIHSPGRTATVYAHISPPPRSSSVVVSPGNQSNILVSQGNTLAAAGHQQFPVYSTTGPFSSCQGSPVTTTSSSRWFPSQQQQYTTNATTQMANYQAAYYPLMEGSCCYSPHQQYQQQAFLIEQQKAANALKKEMFFVKQHKSGCLGFINGNGAFDRRTGRYRFLNMLGCLDRDRVTYRKQRVASVDSVEAPRKVERRFCAD